MPVTGARCATIAAVSLLLGASPGSGEAWNPVKALRKKVDSALSSGGKKLGKGLGEGAVEALQPALASTLGQAEAAVDRVADNLEARVGTQIVNVRGAATELISQAKGTVDDTLDRIDHTLEKRILQIQRTADGTIEKLDQKVSNVLADADQILRLRSERLGEIVRDIISRTDDALAARIDQIDEVVGRRLGNVDVLATNQRLALEQALLRVAVLIGLVVFIVFVIRTLWKEYLDLVPKLETVRGTMRSWAYARRLGWTLARSLVGAGVVVALLLLLADRLPVGAKRQAQKLIARHEHELSRHLTRLDVARVRFHSSQLEILVPAEASRYQAVAAKVELIRDVLTRPALMSTERGLEEVVNRVQDIESLLDGSPDPDVLSLKGLVLWQVGATRRDEHEAASLCARALRISPKGFALAPLARSYVRAFLYAPYVPYGTPLGRASERVKDLRAILEDTPEPEVTFPLSHVIAFDRLLADLDGGSTRAYLKMLDAHAEVVRLTRSAPSRTIGKGGQVPGSAAISPELAAARQRRLDAAREVVKEWDEFDRKIAETPGLPDSPAVLAVFRLNDAVYSRARWFIVFPETTEAAPILADIAQPARRAALEPPRVRWERRYGQLFDRPNASVIEFQETERFRAFEHACRTFEKAYVADRVRSSTTDRFAASFATAVAAAHLGLYVDSTDGRVSLAEWLLDQSKSWPAASSPERAELDATLELRGVRFL